MDEHFGSNVRLSRAGGPLAVLQGGNIMSIPKFTAEVSLYKSSRHYLVVSTIDYPGDRDVRVAQIEGLRSQSRLGTSLCPGAYCAKGQCTCCCLPGERCVRTATCCH